MGLRYCASDGTDEGEKYQPQLKIQTLILIHNELDPNNLPSQVFALTLVLTAKVVFSMPSASWDLNQFHPGKLHFDDTSTSVHIHSLNKRRAPTWSMTFCNGGQGRKFIL